MLPDDVGVDNSEDILNRVAIDAALAKLTPVDREIMGMVTAYERPEEYDGPWPATLADVGRYIGLKYKGRALSEAAIRNRRDAIVARWAQRRSKSAGA